MELGASSQTLFFNLVVVVCSWLTIAFQTEEASGEIAFYLILTVLVIKVRWIGNYH